MKVALVTHGYLGTYPYKETEMPRNKQRVDPEYLEVLLDQDMAPHHLAGEKLDGWDCGSRQRTLFSENKRKDVRRRAERCSYTSA